MSEQTVTEKLLNILKQNGIDISKLDSQQLQIELTKTLQITRVPKLTLDAVLPYPVKPPDQHIHYFIDDEKIEAIRDFLQYLLAKQGNNETLIYKMAMETPDTIMNNKEIIMQLERLAQTDRQLANIFIHLHSWYSPAEGYHFRFIYGVSQALEQAIIHYNRLSSEYKAEAKFHGVGAVVKAHEANAELDYWNLRSLLHGLENKVTMLSELVKKSEQFEEFGALRRREVEIQRQREQKSTLSLQVQPSK